MIYPPDQQIERADTVVVGTIVSLVRPTNEDGGGASMDLEGAIQVERYVKGSGPERLDFLMRDFGPWEGLGVDSAGHRFLLFLEEGPMYRTGLCMGNTPLNDERGRETLQEVLAAAGTPSKVVVGLERVDNQPAYYSPALLGLAGAGILGLAAVGAGVVAVQRRRE